MINNSISFIISIVLILYTVLFFMTGCMSKKPIKQPIESETSVVEPISLLTHAEQITVDVITPTHTFGILIGFVGIVVISCVVVPKLINYLRNR